MKLIVAVLCATALAGCGRWGFADQPDATPPDAAIDLACDVRTPAGTVALFTFDGEAPLADGTGVHDGWIRGDAAPIAGRCGAALGMAAIGDYAGIPDSPAFDLDAGAVSLYARIDALGVRHGLLSRDANGTDTPGHMSLGTTLAGHVWVRMQLPGDQYFFRCSDAPITPGQWFHIGVSFGPPGMSLWIDRQPQRALAELDVWDDGSLNSCVTPHTGGIAGNANVWVIGALIYTAIDGSPDPVPVEYLAGGAVDHVRITDAWTDFAAP